MKMIKFYQKGKIKYLKKEPSITNTWEIMIISSKIFFRNDEFIY
jgi:hypothetical protein